MELGKMMRGLTLATAAVLLAAAIAVAGEADIVAVNVQRSGDGTYRFDVTIRHDDEGWHHYADRWEVVGPNNRVLATRVLRHPHVNEQPFTRSLSGVAIPDSVREVTVRAHDLVHGSGGKEMRVAVPGRGAVVE